MKKIILIVLVISSLNNCFSQNNAYSFFVAGHTYGNPGSSSLGLFYQFVDLFPYIQSKQEIKFGVLTGDVVKNPSTEAWDAVDEDIADLGLPVYIAVGNHDMRDRQLYEQRYGQTYYYFIYEGDLFIVLDPNIDNWNISPEQIDLINDALVENIGQIENVFVFFHQLLWWDSDNIYRDIKVNSTEGRAETINFWTEIEPLFNRLSKNVTMFAGDVGGGSWASNFMYDNYQNMTFIASGMGNHVNDNFVIVNVSENKQISYDVVCINEDEYDCLGDIEQYDVYPNPYPASLIVKIYPNPFKNYIVISGISDSFLEIYNTNGKILFQKKLIDEYNRIYLDFLPKGIYFFRINNIDTVSYYKVVKT